MNVRLADRLFYIKMEGNDVFKHAVRAMEEAACTALTANGMTPSDVSLLIPHQANRRIIDATAKRLGIAADDDRLFVNLHNYGNTSSASIPICLDEANRSGRMKSGDIVLLACFRRRLYLWFGPDTLVDTSFSAYDTTESRKVHL